MTEQQDKVNELTRLMHALLTKKLLLIDGKWFIKEGDTLCQPNKIELLQYEQEFVKEFINKIKKYEQEFINKIKKSLEHVYAKKPRWMNDSLWIKDDTGKHWHQATADEFEEFKEIRQYQQAVTEWEHFNGGCH